MYELNGVLQVFIAGFIGGGLAEFLRWYRLRESLNFPQYTKSGIYWGLTIGMMVLGGAIACLYGVDAKDAILVIHIGASAPIILSRLVPSSSDEVDPQLIQELRTITSENFNTSDMFRNVDLKIQTTNGFQIINGKRTSANMSNFLKWK
nr:hypothetical protein [uncultured Methanolobus sp.]